MSEWRETVWGEACVLAYGKAIKGYHDKTEGIPVFGTNGQIGWWDRPLQSTPGIVVGRKGAYRGIHYSAVPFFVIDTAYALTPGPSLDPRWAYYCLLGVDINSMDSGSAIPSTNRDEFYSMPLLLPPLPEQREIASVLGALDDKIELNRKTAAVLEAMARALYRSWFVDFDPVCAKAEGRPPAHMDATTAALFPDGFDDEGLPLGWDIVAYLDLIDIISGGTPKTSEAAYWGGEIPWFSVVDAPADGQVFVLNTEKTITEVGMKKSAVKPIKRGTTIISARGTVGKLAMAARDMVFNQSCYGLTGRHAQMDAFTYFATARAVEQLQSMAHGSVFSTITRKTFEGVSLIQCAPDVLDAFEKQVSGYLDRILSLGAENQTLATLRDGLLPRLMSGELRVGAARGMLSKVA